MGLVVRQSLHNANDEVEVGSRKKLNGEKVDRSHVRGFPILNASGGIVKQLVPSTK